MNKKQISRHKFHRVMLGILKNKDNCKCIRFRYVGKRVSHKIYQVYSNGFVYNKVWDLCEPQSLDNPKYYRLDTIN